MTKKKPDFLRDLDTAIMDELTGGGIKGNAAGLVGTLTQIKEIKQLCGLPFCGYMAKLETVRPSGVPDEVTVVFAEDVPYRACNGIEFDVMQEFVEGSRLLLTGKVQTLKDFQSGRLLVYILADFVAVSEKAVEQDEAAVRGVIANKPTYRETPRGKAQALELRRRMLKIFNPELSATLVYEYGGFKRVIDCRAYGEPKILKKEVLYEFDLQIECLNPFWREEEETKEDIASWVAAWHFPCVIEKDSTKSMIYGYRAESVIVDCYNEGDVSTGMRIRFTALGTVSNPILLNVDTEEFIQINSTMKTGDVIEINTKYGSKGAKLIRDGVETDYFRYIDVDSTFMQLAIGDNMFRYDAASGVNSLEVSIFYSKEFLGV